MRLQRAQALGDGGRADHVDEQEKAPLGARVAVAPEHQVAEGAPAEQPGHLQRDDEDQRGRQRHADGDQLRCAPLERRLGAASRGQHDHEHATRCRHRRAVLSATTTTNGSRSSRFMVEPSRSRKISMPARQPAMPTPLSMPTTMLIQVAEKVLRQDRPVAQADQRAHGDDAQVQPEALALQRGLG